MSLSRSPSSVGSRPLGARSMGFLCEAANAARVEFSLSGALEAFRLRPALEAGRGTGATHRMVAVERRVGGGEVGAGVRAPGLRAQQGVGGEERHERVGVAEQPLEPVA